MKPTTVIACLTVLAAGAGLAGCGGSAASQQQGDDADSTAAPSLRTVDTVSVVAPVSLTTQLYVEHDALVYARTTGIVDSVFVDLGSRVREGQLLALVEDVDQAIALEEAEESARVTTRDVERARELAESGHLSPADLEAAELSFRRAELALRQAHRDLALTRVRAPFDGVVTARTIRPGRLAAAGDSLFRVTALRPLLASVRIPEASAEAVEVGSEAAVVAADGRSSPATVIRASPIIDAASGTREAVVRLSGTGGMRPGMTVDVHLGAEARTVLALPTEALTEDGYVLVWENGHTALRAVTLGSAIDSTRVEVIAGLSPGDRVVLTNP